MKKLLACLLFVGILAVTGVPAFASGTDSAKENDLSAFTEFMGDVDCSALHLDDFSTKNVEIDAFMKQVKGSEFLKNLDLSALNYEAVVKLTEDQDLLKAFGIEKVDPAGLKAALDDARVQRLTKQLMTNAAEGISIDAQARALANNEAVKTLFSNAAGGADLAQVLAGMNSDNMAELLNKAAEALTSENSGDASEAAKSLEALVKTGVTALRGE